MFHWSQHGWAIFVENVARRQLQLECPGENIANEGTPNQLVLEPLVTLVSLRTDFDAKSQKDKDNDKKEDAGSQNNEDKQLFKDSFVFLLSIFKVVLFVLPDSKPVFEVIFKALSIDELEQCQGLELRED